MPSAPVERLQRIGFLTDADELDRLARHLLG